MTPLEIRLRQLTATLDESALEALASKGLLRRARKDLERGGEIGIAGEAGGSLRVRVNEHEVTLPEAGPAKASCSCPAAGVCQHILSAVLFLQQHVSGNVDAGSAGGGVAMAQANDGDAVAQELMRYSPEQLEQWAGRAAYRAAMKIASHAAEISSERGVCIRFNSINAECHIVPGGGLDGMIVSGGKGDGREIAVAAVISFQRAKGIAWAGAATEAGALEESDGAPRSRAEVLDACQSLMDETLSNGLSRLSSANQQRWATLAVSGLGVNLPRLALLLRGVSDEAALSVARDARADLGRMLSRMAHTYALCAALQNGGDNPRADLVGWHRSQYAEIGNVDLVGVAAWPWRTASGYEGLTVLFWDAKAKRWCSWSDSRPRHQLAGYSAVARYTQTGPWEGAESPRQLARNAFRLMNARRSPAWRLSGSSKSRALVTGPVNIKETGLAPIEDWSQLSQQLGAQLSAGLKEPNPLDSIFTLKPAVWRERNYDAVAQIFSWCLADSQQRLLFIEIAFDELSKPAIQFLESVSPGSLQGACVIGRVQRTPLGLSLHPYSIHRENGEVTQLYLDGAKPDLSQLAAIPSADDAELDDEAESESMNTFSPALNRLLDEVDDSLLAVAESGLAGLNPLRVERLLRIAPGTERLGLGALAASLEKVTAQREPSAVLRCSYLSQLHRRVIPF